jgi:hypothetical protein
MLNCESRAFTCEVGCLLGIQGQFSEMRLVCFQDRSAWKLLYRVFSGGIARLVV